MTLTTIRERVTVSNGGRVEIPPTFLEDGTEVEVLILVEEEIDETEYLLSTPENRKRMYEALEELKHPENFIPLNAAEYEGRITDS
ncbi:MAG: hypothetical protein ACRD6X_10365 [Pyrinomonadaceae bacterium]